MDDFNTPGSNKNDSWQDKGFIKFNSINFLALFSREKEFFLANSFICLIEDSPIDLFGLLIILSKDKSLLG